MLERDDSHELYNLGHLFEAAIAHHQATGKRSLLDIAVKAADLLVRTFGPGKRSIWPGHQITEMGLVKLARVTGKPEYLALAKFLLDERGPAPLPPGERANPRGLDYNQSQQRVVEQTEPVGHAVRAMYMYSGMADVAALTGDPTYVRAIDTIWRTPSAKKLYITGGIGASGVGEAFGSHYELPNMTAYNETCASIGMDYWNHRLFLLHGDAKYIDVMERTLYNGLISGVSLDGKTFFYPNPLESRGQHQRSPWFGVACCPGNITRFLASVPGYVYAKAQDAVYVNLYVPGTGDIALDGNRTVKLTQQTRYPWDGAVKITVAPEPAGTFAINVRIPGWAREEPVPGDLYRFLDTAPPATLKVNGAAVPMTIDKGYVRLSRAWQRGDTIELDLPMPVRRLVAHEKVADDAGRVALQRGPIVYAAEWPDNPDGRVRNLVLPDASADVRSSGRAAERRDGGDRARARACRRRPRRCHRDRPAAHRDSVRDVGEPRRGRDDRVAAAHRRRRASDAVSDARHRRHDHGVGAGRGAWQEHASDCRRRGAALVRRPVVVLRLVADARQRRRVGRDDVREAGDGLGSLGLLVRRHRPRLGARAGVVADPLQGRGRLEAGRGGRRLRRRARSLQPRVVQAGHDGRPADRGDHAADVLGRAAGVDGEVRRIQAANAPTSTR